MQQGQVGENNPIYDEGLVLGGEIHVCEVLQYLLREAMSVEKKMAALKLEDVRLLVHNIKGRRWQSGF